MDSTNTTRKRTSPQSSSHSISTTAQNMPPPRRSEPLKPVSPPLSSTRLSRLVYILALLTLLLGAYYSYRGLQYKTAVGGWWNLALGRKPPQLQTTHDYRDAGDFKPRHKGEESVEDRINALASALGMPSNELASAIAGAVHQYVPPASLTSVAARETGPVVEALLEEHDDQAPVAKPEAHGIVEEVISGMESFVGMDEP
ncbi:hypothetical protein B0H34DRAFT_724933 [Crassisporium funariophilum]|nr:hypothetical protein B0H34DRAFT_724933 [Crassisporium funariophilum]